MLRVGIQVDLVGSYGRDVLRGIMQFANRAGNWEFVLPPMYSLGRKKTVSPQSVDGMLAMIHDVRAVPPFRRAGVPIVNVARTLTDEQLVLLRVPSVLPDDVAVGRMAYEYFRDRGFINFGFCGHPRAGWSRTREAAFIAAVNEGGHACFRVDVADDVPVDWMKSVPLPAAILAGNDRYAWHAVDACRAAGLRVPEDVAILGVDNDVLLVDMVRPTLSSITANAAAIGFEAGRVLAELMNGGEVSLTPTLIAPDGIVTRHSTDVMVMEDQAVVDAVRFIRENGAKLISVEDVLNAAATGRRTLERRFKTAMGRSIHQEIRRIRMDRAMKLLRETTLDMPAVAEQCGFAGHARFSTVFRKQTGLTPTDYRRKLRGGR